MMYLMTMHNVDVHMQRVKNGGILNAWYKADDEVKEAALIFMSTFKMDSFSQNPSIC